MLQIASDLYQALGILLQVNTLLAERGIYDRQVRMPVQFPDLSLDDKATQISISADYRYDKYEITWSCGLELVVKDDQEESLEGIRETYQSVVLVSICERLDKYSRPMFEIEYIAGTEVPTWRLLTKREAAVKLLEQVASKNAAARLLEGDVNHLEHVIALELMSAVLPLVGATKIVSDRPAPITMPSPGASDPDIPTPG